MPPSCNPSRCPSRPGLHATPQTFFRNTSSETFRGPGVRQHKLQLLMDSPILFPECVAKGSSCLNGGLGARSCLTHFRRVCTTRPRALASVRGVSAWAWLLGAAIQRVSSGSPRACVWTFRAAGVGNRGSARGAGSRDGVSRGRRGEGCDLVGHRASFCVAGARNRARQLKLLDCMALCEKKAARAYVDV